MKSNTKLYIAGALIIAGGLILWGRAVSNPTPSSGGVVNEAQAAPDFTLTSLDGEKITLSDYKGDKPVVLDFWATWCHNCQRAMPKTSKLYEKYGDQIEVIGINLQENKSAVQKFVDGRGIKFPIVLDPQSSASRAYGVRYTNMHVLINKDGTIARTIQGDVNESHFKSLLN